MKLGLHSGFVLSVLLSGVLCLAGCDKASSDPSDPLDEDHVEEVITASQGGTVTTPDGIELVIPPNALPSDGTVGVAPAVDAPESVPNPQLTIVGEPIAIELPTASLSKPVQLSYPRPSGLADTSNYFVFLYNGSTYYPAERYFSDNKVIVIFDNIEWDSAAQEDPRSLRVLGSLIVFGLQGKQMPSAHEMGLQKVTLQSGVMHFDPTTATSSSKVLLLIHGWTGSAGTWKVFIPYVLEQTSPSYSEIWLFVYNSSLSISHNASQLKQFLMTQLNGAEIDIVAHSMGGLVARSMIEQYGGSIYINRLVTLGTPHKGSPLAALEYALGAIVATDFVGGLWTPYYLKITQGLRDLKSGSSFIENLDALVKPPRPYFLIAATNTPSKNPLSLYSSNIIQGPDDGVVSVSSATDIHGAWSLSEGIKIDAGFAHMQMTDDINVIEQALAFLRLEKPSVTTSTVSNITQTSATVGGTVIIEATNPLSECGVYWGTSEHPELTGTKLQIEHEAGEFSVSLADLLPETTYYVTAYATNCAGTSYGNSLSFTTEAAYNYDVLITLTWNNDADLDLHVIDPFGEEIWFNNTISESGGILDIDDLDGFGPENVSWPVGGAPTGEYNVYVHHYYWEDEDWRPNSASFTVSINAFGTTRQFVGSVSIDEVIHITDFDLNRYFLSPSLRSVHVSRGKKK